MAHFNHYFNRIKYLHLLQMTVINSTNNKNKYYNETPLIMNYSSNYINNHWPSQYNFHQFESATIYDNQS